MKEVNEEFPPVLVITWTERRGQEASFTIQTAHIPKHRMLLSDAKEAGFFYMFRRDGGRVDWDTRPIENPADFVRYVARDMPEEGKATLIEWIKHQKGVR